MKATIDLHPPCRCPRQHMLGKTLRYLKLLVLQLPLVQGLIYFILLVMWAEAESLYQTSYLYLQPIIMASIVCGIWGMLMTVNILNETLKQEFFLQQKFAVLQMVLVFAKAQGITTKILVWYGWLPCNPPMTPETYANLIHNSLMILEMVLLGLMARNLYKREIPNIAHIASKQSSIISTVFSDDSEKGNNNVDGVDNLGCVL